MGSVICQMARRFDGVEGRLRNLRKELESQVSRAHGVGRNLSAVLDSAVGLAIDAERCRQKAQRIARDADEAGDHTRAMELEKTAFFMAQQRDQAVRRLGIDAEAEPSAEAVYQGAQQLAVLSDPMGLEKALAAEEAAA